MFKSSVIKRISFGYALILASMVAISLFALFRLSSLNDNVQKITQIAQPIDKQVVQISSEIQQLNLIIYQHYHAKTQQRQLDHETAIVTLQRTIEKKTLKLKRLLSKLPDSSQSLMLINELESKSAVTFKEQAQSMKVATQALTSKLTLNALNLDLSALEERFTQFEKSNRHMQGAFSEYVTGLNQLRFGFSLAKQMILINDVTQFNQLTTQYKSWLTDYVRQGYLLQQLSQQQSHLVNPVKTLANIAADLVWLLDNKKGVKELQRQYLSSHNTLEINLNKIEKNLLAAQSKAEQLGLISQAYSNDIEQVTAFSMKNSQWWIAIVTIATLLVALLIAVYIVRSIKKPLNNVITVIERLATGDLASLISATSKDEFSKVSGSLQQLRSAFAKIVTAIQRQSITIGESIEVLSAGAIQSSEIANQQKQQTTQVASAVLEMTATSSEISNTAERATDLMSQASNSAIHSQGLVQGNQAVSSQLQSEINAAADVVASLDEECQQIEDVLNVIVQVAEQTNLLALNAAIEAARAGAHGRGFAVVAEEVRSLATRTQSSTEQIKTRLSALLSASSQAVVALQSSVNKSIDSSQMAKDIEVQINEFASTVTNAHQLNEVIADAARQQHIAAREISHNIENIDELSGEALQQTELTAGAMHGLSDSAATLVTMNQEFQVRED